MRTHVLSYGLMFLTFIFVVVGCDNSEDPVKEFQVLNVTPISIEFKSGYSRQVNVDYSGSWTASLSDDSWCSIDKTSGLGNGVITISLKERVDPSAKSSMLTIISSERPSQTKTIIVSCRESSFTALPDMLFFQEGHDDIKITMPYSLGWNASLTDDSWCNIDRMSGNGGEIITISLKERMDPGELTTSVSITSSITSIEKIINIILPAVKFEVSPESISTINAANAYVAVDYLGKWTASLSDDSWCRIDKVSGTGRDRINITLFSNNESNSSSLTITPVEFPWMNVTIPIYPGIKMHHGQSSTLNKSTKGQGIDVVILGDGFTADDMGEGGLWATTLEQCIATIFKLEPFKTFREYFNVYAVTAISESDRIETISSNTFFGSMFREPLHFIMSYYYHQKAYDFAYNNSPVKEDKGIADDMLVVMIVNDERYGGGAYINQSKDPGYGRGIGISSLHPSSFDFLVVHEALGHAFGGLADEYITKMDVIGNDNVAGFMRDQQEDGLWQNVEYTNKPAEFINKNWRSLYESGYPGVSIIEGGHYYQWGVWRSWEESIMNDNSNFSVFNTVSREILVRQIYKLAGMEDQYSLDVFKEYDRINTSLVRRQAESIAIPPASLRLPPPIVQ